MDDHLLSYIERFKNDTDLYAEAKAKLDTRVQEMVATSITRGARISEVPDVLAMAAPANFTAMRRLQESIARAQFRPVFVIRDNHLTADFVGPDSAVWKDRLTRQQKIIDRVIPCVGRVEINNNAIYNWAGTGWLIDSEVMVTNRHVASIFSQNREGFAFKVGYPSGMQSAKIDFLEEDRRDAASEFAVDSVLWMSENLENEPDVAFLRLKTVSGGPPLPGPIPLAASPNPGEIAITIGYPARDPDIPDQNLVQHVFGDVYEKKRLAPGEIVKVTDNEIEHDCSTLGGNSGSAVISLATGEALGLHFAGLYMEANYAVSAPKLRELLDKLQKRSLPRMRAVEISTSMPSMKPPAPAPALVTSVNPGGGGTFTLEAYVPIRVTLEIGGAVSGTPGGALAAPSAPAIPTDNIYQAALQTAREQLRSLPGVLDVRLGYRFRRGWITDERVIVVEVREKQSLPALREAGKQLVPAQILGVGVDVRTAALAEQLAAHVSFAQLEAPSRPGVYREPPDLRLERVKAPMRAIFHVSPDSGFPNLKSFIHRIQERMTATIYEWEPNHISDELFNVINAGNRKLTMVVERKGTSDAVEKLELKLKQKFDHVWASTGAGKIVPNAYHIKVACRDGEEFWLSSGNWKDSNQADIDPAGEGSTAITPLRQHNREWHAIIQNAKLAKCFEEYIKWDYEEAQRVPIDEVPEPVWPDVFVPIEVTFERRGVARYFEPLIIDRELDVTPLLTPDRDSRGKRIFIEAATRLIDGATQSIDLQNQSFNLLDDNIPEFEAFFVALKQKQRQRGVEVRIIFRDGREFSQGNAVSQQKLLERIKDFGIDTKSIRVQRKCHTKAIIVDADDKDRAAVLFGSHNLTNAGALYNRDASLLIRDHEVANYFRTIFNFDWDVLATQDIEETIGGIRIAGPDEATPEGFRRVSLKELMDDD